MQKGPHSGGRNTTYYQCGRKHEALKCKYKKYECHHCQKKGHLASVCCKKRKDLQVQPEKTHLVVADVSDEVEYAMYQIAAEQQSHSW